MIRLALTSIDTYVGKFVRDRRLRQILEYPMVFLGTSPFSAPAIYSLMSALDFKEGIFYPQGGMYTIITSLVGIGKKLEVAYHYNAEVTGIIIEQGAARGVRLADGSEQWADYIISNADLHFTETKLLASEYQTYPEEYWHTKEPSPSALLMYIGVKGDVPEFEHHNLLFVDDWQGNFKAIYTDKVFPHPASMYICKASATDKDAAPEGYENIFVLVPLPAGTNLSQKEVRDLSSRYLAQIHTMTGVDLAAIATSQSFFGPNDFATRYYSWQSSMLGQSHTLRQSAFFRTPNISKKVKNLLYVGGSTTPGIGMPMCLIGAELVYKRLIKDVRGGSVRAITNLDDAA